MRNINKLFATKFSFFMLLATVTAAPLAGCGKSDIPAGPTGTLSGTVTYNGSPPPAGSAIALMHEKTGFVAVGSIGSDGRYTARMNDQSKLPVGTYQISVTGPPAPAMTPDQMAAMYEGKSSTQDSNASGIPAKYVDPATSGLTFEVQEGANTYDVELTD